MRSDILPMPRNALSPRRRAPLEKRIPPVTAARCALPDSLILLCQRRSRQHLNNQRRHPNHYPVLPTAPSEVRPHRTAHPLVAIRLHSRGMPLRCMGASELLHQPWCLPPCNCTKIGAVNDRGVLRSTVRISTPLSTRCTGLSGKRCVFLTMKRTQPGQSSEHGSRTSSSPCLPRH